MNLARGKVNWAVQNLAHSLDLAMTMRSSTLKILPKCPGCTAIVVVLCWYVVLVLFLSVYSEQCKSGRRKTIAHSLFFQRSVLLAETGRETERQSKREMLGVLWGG